MPTILQTFRHLRRYQQIARILSRYGFGHVLTQLGIGRAIAPGLEKLRFSSAEILRATPPERVRMAIEDRPISGPGVCRHAARRAKLRAGGA